MKLDKDKLSVYRMLKSIRDERVQEVVEQRETNGNDVADLRRPKVVKNTQVSVS